MSRTTGTRRGETEVFAISPELGKCYKHVEATRTTGINPNEKYYTTNTPRFVGRFIREERYGYGDGASIFAFFQDDSTGAENSVEYSYEGNTCFIEVDCETLAQQASARAPLPAPTPRVHSRWWWKQGREGGKKKRKSLKKKRKSKRRKSLKKKQRKTKRKGSK
jgi:hypothetical protein